MIPIELPTFEASWWPVQLETVPGSGERITIAVIVRAASGQSQVRQTIPPASLTAMFGPAGKGMVYVVGQTVLALDRQIDAGVAVDNLEMPFGGVCLGVTRDCVARDFNEIFQVAFRLSGAFSQSQFGIVEKPSADTQKAFDEWADRIKMQFAGGEDEGWASAFKVPVPLQHRKRNWVGFMRGDYAANFGVLRPGRSIHSDVRALKVKLFDLEVLRRTNSVAVQRAELIVGCVDWVKGGSLRQREFDAMRESWEFVSHEAKQRGLTAVHYERPVDAATYLKLQAA